MPRHTISKQPISDAMQILVGAALHGEDREARAHAVECLCDCGYSLRLLFSEMEEMREVRADGALVFHAPPASPFPPMPHKPAKQRRWGGTSIYWLRS